MVQVQTKMREAENKRNELSLAQQQEQVLKQNTEMKAMNDKKYTQHVANSYMATINMHKEK